MDVYQSASRSIVAAAVIGSLLLASIPTMISVSSGTFTVDQLCASHNKDNSHHWREGCNDGMNDYINKKEYRYHMVNATPEYESGYDCGYKGLEYGMCDYCLC